MHKPRHRSPSYPSITIDDAVVRAKELYSKEGKHPTLTSTAVSHWGYKQKSSGGLKTVSTLKSYGLITDAGSGADRTIKLSDTGLAIARDERQDSSERDALIAEAALKPKIISDLWARYGESLPSLDTVKHYLVNDRDYNPNAFSDIIRTYKAAVSWRTKEISGDIDESFMEANAGTQAGRAVAQGIAHKVAPLLDTSENQEIANIRVSRSCTIRLLADGEYDKKSIEALVAHLELDLKMGTFDDLDDDREEG